MSLYENIYNILSKINEADLNKRDSEVQEDFFNKEDLMVYIDGLMDKHNNNIEKVIDELNTHVNSMKKVNDGYAIKEEDNQPAEEKSDYRYGGMETSGIRQNDLKVWELLIKNGINPRIVSQGLKLLDPEMKRGFRLSRRANYNNGNPLFYGNYFITVKDPETNKIHNKYENKTAISLEKLKKLVYDPRNAETIMKNVEYIGDEDSFEDLYDIRNSIQRHNKTVEDWIAANNTHIGAFTPEVQYMCYILSQKEGYPLNVLINFFNSDRATPENIKYLNDYYHINQKNNTIAKESALDEAGNSYPEAVYRTTGKGEEGVIANEALKQLGFSFLIATTLSLPYDEIPGQTVKKLSPFQKPKEIKHKDVRVVAVPQTLAKQLLDIKTTEDGISFDIPENKPWINEEDNVLYVQGDDDVKPFALPIAEIRNILELNGKRFKAGELTPDEQEELLNHRNVTQKGIGGKQIPLNDDQIIKILMQVFDTKPFNIIFETPDQVLDMYRNTDENKASIQLVKHMLNSYIYPKLATQYPGVFDEKHTHNLVKAYPSKNGKVSYRAIVPLNADGVMSVKPNKFDIFDREQ